MTGVFDDAQFGDKFRTRDGRMAIYLGHNKFGTKFWHQLVLDRTPEMVRIKEYGDDGVFLDADRKCLYGDDIIGRWEDIISEEELEGLSLDFMELMSVSDRDEWEMLQSLGYVQEAEA